MKVYKIGLIGCGVAGTILLLKLLETLKPNDICCIDPAFDGGDLGRRWPDVTSNTIWQQFISALEHIPLAQKALKERISLYEPDNVTPVCELSRVLREALRPYLHEMNANTTNAISANYNSQEDVWIITLQDGSIRKVHTLIYSPGGNPKLVNLPKYQIPLEVALDLRRLSKQVEAGQHVLLFGLANSGVLVLKNLLSLGAEVRVIYRSSKPFIYARDGVPGGIKQEAAQFADEIMKTPSDFCKLIHSSDIEGCIRAYNECNTIISAIGFVKNNTSCKVLIDSVAGDTTKYNKETGALEYPHMFGFGISYPSITTYENKIYEDVGIGAFVKHISECLPKILDDINRPRPTAV